MLAYVQTIQRQERQHQVETLTHQKWSGAEYYDNLMKTVQGGVSSTAALGKVIMMDRIYFAGCDGRSV